MKQNYNSKFDIEGIWLMKVIHIGQNKAIHFTLTIAILFLESLLQFQLLIVMFFYYGIVISIANSYVLFTLTLRLFLTIFRLT